MHLGSSCLSDRGRRGDEPVRSQPLPQSYGDECSDLPLRAAPQSHGCKSVVRGIQGPGSQAGRPATKRDRERYHLCGRSIGRRKHARTGREVHSVFDHSVRQRNLQGHGRGIVQAVHQLLYCAAGAGQKPRKWLWSNLNARLNASEFFLSGGEATACSLRRYDRCTRRLKPTR